MPYCTYQDLRLPDAVLVQLTDDESLSVNQNSLSSSISSNPLILTRISAEIDSSDSLIDSYLRKLYSVPLATTPDIVKRISVSLTRYGLYFRRSAQGFAVSDDMKSERDQAMTLLRDIVRGTVDLDVVSQPSASESDYLSYSGSTVVFTDDALERF